MTTTGMMRAPAGSLHSAPPGPSTSLIDVSAVIGLPAFPPETPVELDNVTPGPALTTGAGEKTQGAQRLSLSDLRDPHSATNEELAQPPGDGPPAHRVDFHEVVHAQPASTVRPFLCGRLKAVRSSTLEEAA